MKHLARFTLPLASLLSLVACGGGVPDTAKGEGGYGGASSASTSTGTSTSTTGSGGASSSSGTGGNMPVSDPNKDGPYTITEIDDQIQVQATGHTAPIHCAYPTAGPSAGPYPVVLVAHGFQLPASQYYSYVKRLASFGYVALTVDFPTSFQGPDNTNNALDLLAGLEWAKAKAELAGKADVENAGATGHSLGGKLSLLAASLDPRIKASLVLDPIDGAPGNPFDPMPMCNPPSCVDVSALLPSLSIPTGFVGEINDATGGIGGACAPAAENYTTFYASAKAPSLEVTATKAKHMSFVDNLAACGLPCIACAGAGGTIDAEVRAMATSYVVAFYERHLRDNAGYDTYLTGADAQARYVQTGQATIKAK